MKFFLGIILITLIFSCQSEKPQAIISQASPLVIQENQSKLTTLAAFFEPMELQTILSIKESFEEGLAKKKPVDDIASLYKDHALRMRLDLFNNYPYTLNFPYDGTFDLSEVDTLVKKLSFVTNKCGFQGEDGKAINYYCMNTPSNYTKFLESLGKENELIKRLLDDYNQKKSISNEAKQMLVMSSETDLDLNQLEQQIVYMFFHLFVNEERIAFDSAKSLNK